MSDKIGDIDIDGLIYEILISEHNKEFEKDADGQTLFKKLKIYVDKDLPTLSKKETIYHEIVHTLFDRTNLDACVEKKLGEFYEPFVDALAIQLFRFIEKNSHMLAHINEILDNRKN